MDNTSKHILIIMGHPSQSSLCQHLADEYAAGAEEAGAVVRTLALADMQFDLDLKDRYRTPAQFPLEADLQEAQRQLQWADHLVIVSPIWWGMPPALLKGFFDRVLLPGFAYKYHQRGLFPEKLLKGKSARVIFTMDNPVWYYRVTLLSPMYWVIKHQILGFVGYRPIRFTNLGEVRFASPQKIERWSGAVRRLGQAFR